MTVENCELSIGEVVLEARQLEATFSDIFINAAMDAAIEKLEVEIDHVRSFGHASANRIFSPVYRALEGDESVLIRAHRFIGNLVIFCATSENPRPDQVRQIFRGLECKLEQSKLILDSE